MTKPPPRAATIRDVARLSGVSIATVTRTFQNSPAVRSETSQRVREAAQQLGYRPDEIARTLVTGKSNSIGLLVPSLVQAYWGEVADAIEHRASELGYSLILASSRGEAERESYMLDLLFGKRLDAIIMASVSGDPQSWPNAGSRRPPIVLLEWDTEPHWNLLEEFRDKPLSRQVWRLSEQPVPGDWYAHVTYDDIVGGSLVAEHLLNLGHTSIAFVIGPPVRGGLLRLLGVRGALEEAGCTLQNVYPAEDSFEGGRRIGKKIFAEADPPTAVVCYDDAIAIGLIRAAHDLGLSVPGDVAVTGYDDIEVASYLDPPLTTFRNPKRELGELALDLSLRASSGDSGPIYEKLTGSLVVRDSTGSPERRSASAASGG